jgi:hypothetical protein
MKLFKVLFFAAAMALVSASGASANTYATSVDWQPGTGGNVDPTRSNPSFALGTTNSNFLSLGLGGLGVFSFSTPFTGPGNVVEVTNGTVATYPESAKIYVGSSYTPGSFDISSFMLLTTISNIGSQAPLGVTIPFGGTWLYLAIRDFTIGGPSTDGFDVNSVGVAAVPLPAGVALLGAGLGVLGFVGWRKKRSAGLHAAA